MRLQLALNVEDLDAAIEFYSAMFTTEPTIVRDGYANFAIEQPPLKLVLFAGQGPSGSINHLGVEVSNAEAVEKAEARLRAAGLATTGVADTACCYALKTETWLEGPDGTRWEWYVRTGDSDTLDNRTLSTGASTCCEEVTGVDGAHDARARRVG